MIETAEEPTELAGRDNAWALAQMRKGKVVRSLGGTTKYRMANRGARIQEKLSRNTKKWLDWGSTGEWHAHMPVNLVWDTEDE